MVFLISGKHPVYIFQEASHVINLLIALLNESLGLKININKTEKITNIKQQTENKCLLEKTNHYKQTGGTTL